MRTTSVDRGGQPIPVGGFFVEMPASRPRQRVELRAAIVLAELPLGCDPAFVFELVERRIQRAVADLEDIARDLAQALADGPAVLRLERQDLQNQQVKRALDEVGWSAHVGSLGYRVSTIHQLPSVSKWKVRTPRYARAGTAKDHGI